MGRWRTRGDWWQLLDPEAARPHVRSVMERLLDLVDADGAVDRRFDIGSDAARGFVERHRVVALVPVSMTDTDSQVWLRARQVEVAAAQMRIRTAAARTLDRLSSAGIETRVLKGLATAELDYPPALRRQSGDVDLAVDPDQLAEAVRLLTADGCRDHPTPFDPVLLYGWTLDAPDGVEIDLHTRLFRRSPLGRSLVAESGVPLDTLPGAALPAEQRLVHAAGHFIISPPGKRRMNGFLDISRLLTRPDLDLAGARRFARTLGVESLVGAGIRVEAELSGREAVLGELADWDPPDWLERRTRLVARRRFVLDHLGRYREVPRGHRLEYLPAWLLPSARQRRLFLDSAGSAATRAAGGTIGRVSPVRRRRVDA